MSNKLRVAVIGAGRWSAEAHLPGWQRSPLCELVTICDLDRELAEQRAGEFGAEDITTDYKKYSKSFQVLTYVLMLHLNNEVNLPVEAGIISFKSLSKGLLKFGTKDTPGSRKKDNNITLETLEYFSKELSKLILEICNPEIDFIEKEV